MNATLRNLRQHLPLLLAAPVLLAPVLFVPEEGQWQGLRWFLAQAVGLALLAYLAVRARGSIREAGAFFRTGPNLPILLLFAWAAISFCTSAPPSGRGRDMALVELLRLGTGATLYFAVAYGNTRRSALNAWSRILLGCAALAALAGLVTSTQQEIGWATGAYANPQLLAGFLVLLLPFAVVYALQGRMDLRRVLATVALVFVVGALLVTRNRSAWLGSLAGLVLIAGLWLRTTPFSELARQRHRWMTTLIIAAVGAGLFVAFKPDTGSLVEARAATLLAPGQEPSFQWRLRMWAAGWEMVKARPLAGWGVGSFPRLVGEYAAEAPAAAQVEEAGPSLASVPHNEYVQLGAELGLVGLLLYLAVFFGFFRLSLRFSGATESETRRRLVIACTAAVAAQSIDALGNPAWRFGDVAPLFWLVLGLGVAATRAHEERDPISAAKPVETGPRPRLPMWRWSWQIASLVCALGLGASAFGATVGNQPGILRGYYDPQAVPDLVLSRTTVSFGTVRVTRRRRRPPVVVKTLRITAGGERGGMILGRLTLPPGTPFELIGDNEFRLVKPRSENFRFRFRPTAPGTYTVPVTVTCNDPDTPTVVVTLVGTAL